MRRAKCKRFGAQKQPAGYNAWLESTRSRAPVKPLCPGHLPTALRAPDSQGEAVMGPQGAGGVKPTGHAGSSPRDTPYQHCSKLGLCKQGSRALCPPWSIPTPPASLGTPHNSAPWGPSGPSHPWSIPRAPCTHAPRGTTRTPGIPKPPARMHPERVPYPLHPGESHPPPGPVLAGSPRLRSPPPLPSDGAARRARPPRGNAGGTTHRGGGCARPRSAPSPPTARHGRGRAASPSPAPQPTLGGGGADGGGAEPPPTGPPSSQ